jgi:hypothetical protein
MISSSFNGIEEDGIEEEVHNFSAQIGVSFIGLGIEAGAVVAVEEDEMISVFLTCCFVE